MSMPREIDGYEELGRILRTHQRGLSTRQEAIDSLNQLDPVFRAYRPAESWLDEESPVTAASRETKDT